MLFQQVCKLADLYRAADCYKACITALLSLGPDLVLESKCLALVLQLPDVYRLSEGFDLLLELACRRLLADLTVYSCILDDDCYDYEDSDDGNSSDDDDSDSDVESGQGSDKYSVYSDSSTDSDDDMEVPGVDSSGQASTEEDASMQAAEEPAAAGSSRAAACEDASLVDGKVAADEMLHEEQMMMTLFGNTSHIINIPILFSQFLQLPLQWLWRWAMSPDLVTDHENSLVLLVAAWTKGPEGQRYTRSQLQCVANHLRMWHLSSSYLLGVLPTLPWLDAAQVQRFAMVRNSGLGLQAMEHQAEELAGSYDLPFTWLVATSPRPSHGSSCLPLTFEWQVPVARVEEMIQGMQHPDMKEAFQCSDDLGYYGGFTFRLGLRVAPQGCAWSVEQYKEYVMHSRPKMPKDTFSVGLYLEAVPQLPASTGVVPDQQKGLFLALASYKLACQEASTRCFTYETEVMRAPVQNHLARGLHSFLTPDGPVTGAKDLTRFVVNENLNFRCTITAIG